jgi:carboxypeptidase C (cathepsin A)
MKDYRDLLQIIAREAVEREKKDKKKAAFPGDETSETHHVIEIDGKPIRYKATAGYLKVKDEKQKLKYRMFYISYEKEDVKDKSTRPVTFAFNGGPGAASAWVHFGAMGPKRIVTNDVGEILPPPYRFEDNQETWLEFTDLVFMDPVGTGFSTHDKDEDPKQFFGVEEDFKTGADFIRLYITKNKRWLSPKYLAGESYGTFRSVGITHYLQTKHAMDLNGVILISSALNYLTFDFAPGNDLPNVLFMPAYTATAFYHNRLPASLQQDFLATIKEAEDWAYGEYAVALMKGDSLGNEEKRKVAEKLAYYTALPVALIIDCNLRVNRSRFMKQLLHGDGKVVGLYDSRLTAPDVDPAGENPVVDPSMFNIYGSCIAALKHFLAEELKYDNELPYRPVAKEVGKLWNWSSGLDWGMGYVNVSEKLVQSMSYNKYLRIFMACGYYDLCTPYFLNKYTAEHLCLPPLVKDNFILKNYEAGHMMYVHKPSRIAMRDDLRAFYGG